MALRLCRARKDVDNEYAEGKELFNVQALSD